METHSALSDFSSSEEPSVAWTILSELEKDIKQKIESIGTPLRQWDIRINFGIKTGYNDAFIISGDTREKILSTCLSATEREKTAEIIRPILRGRDINRYGYVFADQYLIATFPAKNYDIDDYPALKNYLLTIGIERLEQTGEEHIVNGERIKARKKTNNKWFETQDSISYWDEFLKPKIMWKRIGSIIRFSYDSEGLFGLDSTCFATGSDIAYLCCVLNSAMGHYLLSNAPRTGTGDLLISVQAVEPLRIPEISQEQSKEYERIVSTIKEEPDSRTEAWINKSVFDLYGLTTEEREYIYNKYK